MPSRVSNRSPSPRSLLTGAGPRTLEPGETAELDLVPHPVHDAWEAAGEVEIAPPRHPDTSEGAAMPSKVSAPRRRGRAG